MVDSLKFVVGSVALLAAPGPTNLLLATSGAIQGVRKSAALLPAVFLGYLIAIAIALVLRIAVSAYLLRIAMALWTTAVRS
jgi:threonine/homoserine/homoserine lactone efflux protein